MSGMRGGQLQRALALGLVALALSACATLKGRAPPPKPAPPPAAPLITPPPPPPPPPVAAAPPQRASCVPRNLPKAPKYPDSDAELREAGGAADRYQLMAAGRLLRIQRLAELERIIEGCR
ncbi:MAG: hypothetical protein ACXWKT_20510 [Caulobacteraceae bacterium]